MSGSIHTVLLLRRVGAPNMGAAQSLPYVHRHCLASGGHLTYKAQKNPTAAEADIIGAANAVKLHATGWRSGTDPSGAPEIQIDLVRNTMSPRSAILLFIVAVSCPPCAGYGRVPEFERYRIDQENCVLDENHLRLVSGTLSIGPSLLDVGTVRRLYSPPYVASDFEAALLFNGHAFPMDGFVWYPNELQRTGRKGNLKISTTLLPLRISRGFIQKVTIENLGKSNEYLEVSLQADTTFDRAPSERWQYSSPRSTTAAPRAVFRSAGRDDDLSDAGFVFENTHGRIILTLIGAHPEVRKDQAVESMTLPPGICRQLTILGVIGDRADYGRLRENLEKTLEENDSAWRALHESLRAAAPELVTDDVQLRRFYDRGFLPLLLNRWDLPEFVAKPHYALDGLDGGGFCTYVWDMAYVSEFLSLTQPAFAHDQIERFLSIDLTKSYAMSPLSGTGVGRWYAYNNYSLMRILLHYLLASGDTSFLQKEVAGRSVIDWALWLARWPARGDSTELLDYGETDNLLELRKTKYEHFVPSPNAERIASIRMAADFCRISGRSEGRLRAQADELRNLLIGKLWNRDRNWMDMVDLEGNHRTVFTVQVFDLLRLGILPRNVADGILTHLNDREFLSNYGLHSLSKTDPGYDERDVDWGGPGAYAGDPPELVEDLYRAGYPGKAEDLLRRILWWGGSFPYLPQAIRADRMDYRRDGLGATISGLAAAQCIVFGLFGVEFQPEEGGQLRISPHAFSGAKILELRNIRFRNHAIGIRVLTNTYEVTVDGRLYSRPLDTPFLVTGTK
jgi:hypothetical protein